MLLNAGDLDLTFGPTTPGWVRTNMGHTYDEATSVAVQPDGKILAAGYADQFGVARYLPNGALDTTFGAGGKVLVNYSGSAEGMALRPDGKIVLAGYDYNVNAGRWDLSLVRLNPNGTLDNTFGTGGRVYADFGDSDQATGVALQADGRIVVSVNTGTSLAAARFLENGASDDSFAFGGLAFADFGVPEQITNAVLVQDDGRVVVAGSVKAEASESVFAVARFDASGALDPDFGVGGITSINVPGTFAGDEVAALAIQGDGKIIAAGSGGRLNFALARLNPDGTLDAGFGTGGIAQAQVGQANNGIEGVVLQEDGRIVAAGFSRNANEWDFGLARFDTAGRLDPSFSGDGIVVSDLGTEWDFGHAVALAPDGDIIVAGEAGEPNVNNDFAVARYQGDAVAVDFATLENGVLRVTGSDASDVISITNSFQGELIAALNGLTERFPFASVNSIEVTGGAGDDELTLNLAVFRHTHFAGGAGNDTAIFNGAEGNDDIDIFRSSVEGGGNDLSLGTDVENLAVNGRFGFDTIRSVQPPLPRLTVDAGEGDDTIDYSIAGQGAILRGGNGNDLILANNFVSDTVNGGAGNDRAMTDPNLDLGIDVETYLNSRINGAVYNDANGNGVYDFGESPLQGWRVYIDANNNGVRDIGETFTDTSDRLSPNYSFTGIPGGTYTVRVEPQAGWQATAPVGAVQTVTVQNHRFIDLVDFGFRRAANSHVTGRDVFYNNSTFDGGSAALNDADDNAVATDKQALLPGATATFANVTSYARGINGVRLGRAGAVIGNLTADDFTFQMGGPTGWTQAPAPSAIRVRTSPIPEDPTRVYLAWADGAIRNTWLRVTVKANSRTSLAAPDEFYFGNLVGEVGDSTTRLLVNALDLAAVKRALNTTPGVTGAEDFTRDGRVNALDLAAARSNLNRSIALLAVPIPGAAAQPASTFAAPITQVFWRDGETPVA